MKQAERTDLQVYLMGIVNNLPETPGCYQYLDDKGKVIYVGKAKNLRRRVSSYFHNPKQTFKTQFLVPKIRDIRYVVVETEADALLLENKLIKNYKPHYNVLLKDDKTYPSIALTKEYLPRLVTVRRRTLRGAQYFGPYSHVPTMYALLDLCRTLYHPRPCRTLMTEEGVKEGKYKVCLRYHMKRCLAPCCGKQSRADYLQAIESCREILRGNTSAVSRRLREQMNDLAEQMRFEEAEVIKHQYLAIEQYRAKSQVVSSVDYHIDVFNIESDDKVAYINYLHVVGGAIVQAFTFEYKKKLGETDAELLQMGIVEMRDRYASDSKEVVVPFPVDLPEDYCVLTVPQKGDKKKLLDLSKLNVKQYQFDRLKQSDKLNPEQKATRLMKEIQRDLGLEGLPLRIELFDNSNLQGSDAVAACVVFDRLRPAKKEYRTYNIKTVEGPDDYASMKEVVRRRYSRLMEEGGTLPNLIIADGGVGQMEVIRQVVEDELGLHIPIAGLAKDGRHRTHELLFGFPPEVVGMKPESELFKLLTHMQDEVHRFAIRFHRKKRSQRQIKSALDELPGVGPATKTLLLRTFGSLKRLREAESAQLEQLIGPKRGRTLYENLHADKHDKQV
ncbi:MAG: excinuclease ABC subunit UvrC [Alloprevotella sp.]|nr:excinuclease ABC subunit UvrC [Alloprevotella sp.]